MNRTQIQQELAKLPLLSGLDNEFLLFLGECAQERKLNKGDVLFRQGERATAFYVVRSGELLIEIPAISGPSLEVQRLCDGKVLGWSWLVSPYKWTFQARAERETTLLEFDAAAILARCEEDPAFGYAMMKRFSSLMSERLEAARRRMMDEWNPPGFA
ncbi:cyclic nucleotide-binding domain-containing protein [Aquisalimonas sp.]|uniref:cyclic nucleotide-binding domain-containing protein n=1 Tax=Aquisalimonas sp. TaxID=1872621 RepID=UPI0025BCBF90|nr:cyclic nucleotide-binding domain-containing protein [Aquisalimonas sp.]